MTKRMVEITMALLQCIDAEKPSVISEWECHWQHDCLRHGTSAGTSPQESSMV